MAVKVEDKSTIKIKNLEETVQKVLEIVPAEHLRGLNKLVFVDQVTEPRIAPAQRAALPGLYHPRMGGQSAWAEVATSVLRPKEKFPRNLMTRLALKPNIAQIVLSLVAQHYYLTLSKGVKKNQLELACRQYVEKNYERWRETQGGLRVRLLRPFRPYLDRFAKKLAKQYRRELEKQKKA